MRDLSLDFRSGINHSKDFLFAFFTRWQPSVLRRFSSILCLYFTRITCYSLESSHAAFLHFFVIKHDGGDYEIPVASMIANREILLPLEEWLK